MVSRVFKMAFKNHSRVFKMASKVSIAKSWLFKSIYTALTNRLPLICILR